MNKKILTFTLILSVLSMIVTQVMLLTPALALVNPDPQHIKGDSGGFTIIPTNDDTGEPKAYGTETLWVTKDTRNLEYAFANIAPGGTVKLTKGTYYVSKNIIGRTSMTLRGEGMDKTTIIARGAKVNGDYRPYPLTPKVEAESFGGLRAPLVFRFTVNDDSDTMKIMCEDLTIKTEGITETWYRWGGHIEGFESHTIAIVVTGNNPGEFDGVVNRIDLKVKKVRIQGTDSNQPYFGVFYVPGGILELMDDMTGMDRYTAEDGIAFQMQAFEPGNGKVEIDGCRFENIRNAALMVDGVSSLPLPPLPQGAPVESWVYPDDWTPGSVIITKCYFENTGFTPCPFAGASWSIWIADSSNADCQITRNTFVDSCGHAVAIFGGISLTGQTGGDPTELWWIPLPATSRYDISDNNIQLIPGLIDMDGIYLFDFGPILASMMGYPACSLKTLDIVMSGNRITFNRVWAGAVLGLGLCDALFKDNKFEGSGLAAIYLGVPAPPDLPYNPAINCVLVDNKVDGFTAFVAPIWLGPDSEYCTVEVKDLAYVVDQGTNNLVSKK